MDRRQLIISLSSVGITSILGVALAKKLLSTSDKRSSEYPEKIRGARLSRPAGFDVNLNYSSSYFSNKSVFSLDPTNNKFQVVELNTPGHVVETHPTDQNLSLVTSGRADSLSLVDWKLGKEVALLRFPESVYCNGHSAFVDDGQSVLVTSKKDGNGQVFQIEIPTLKILNTFRYPVDGWLPHDIVPIGSNRFVLGISNQSTNYSPQIVVFNLAQGQIEYRNKEPNRGSLESKTWLGHLKKIGPIIIGGLNKIEQARLTDGGLLALDLENDREQTLIELGTHGIHTEILSFEYDPSTQYLWFSLPFQKLVLVWNLKSDHLVEAIETPSMVRSISLMSSLDAIVLGAEDHFMCYDRKTIRRMIAVEKMWPSNFFTNTYCAHTRIV